MTGILIAVAVTFVVTVFLTMLVSALVSREKKIEHRIKSLYAVEDPQFARSMGGLLPPPIVAGNNVTPLINGDQIFPAMLSAVRLARKSVCFETFIYWRGHVAETFTDALCERARVGVKVHVLLDWLGSKKMDQSYLRKMEEAGVDVQRYHPLKWYSAWRINHRTHRKLLIVDGRVGFTGGVGIADEWTGHAQDEDHWRDSHFRLEGPAVSQMQAAFMDNWMKTHTEVLHGEEYFPELKAAGSCRAQVFMSSPSEGSESVRLMYLMSIACAMRSIKLASAYFVPDDLSVQSLVAARKRGVKIEVILPGKKIDTQVTRKASRSRWGPLLEAGVEIYEYQPTMFHCKVMIVDGQWTSVGSTNFDNRSFRLNDEANLNILDAQFAAEQEKVFAHDRSRSRQITLEEWRNRPWTEKLAEHAAGLLRSQL
jgi:cardiolipin synthase